MALQPARFTLPFLLPKTRCALTAPFHPYLNQHNRPRRYIFCGTFCLRLTQILPFQEARCSMLSGLSSPINWSDKAACFAAKVSQIIAAPPLLLLFRIGHNWHRKNGSYPFFRASSKSLLLSAPALPHV